MPITVCRWRACVRARPALLPEEDSYTNHIHADDLARIVLAALRLRQTRQGLPCLR